MNKELLKEEIIDKFYTNHTNPHEEKLRTLSIKNGKGFWKNYIWDKSKNK